MPFPFSRRAPLPSVALARLRLAVPSVMALVVPMLLASCAATPTNGTVSSAAPAPSASSSQLDLNVQGAPQWWPSEAPRFSYTILIGSHESVTSQLIRSSRVDGWVPDLSATYDAYTQALTTAGFTQVDVVDGTEQDYFSLRSRWQKDTIRVVVEKYVGVDGYGNPADTPEAGWMFYPHMAVEVMNHDFDS